MAGLTQACTAPPGGGDGLGSRFCSPRPRPHAHRPQGARTRLLRLGWGWGLATNPPHFPKKPNVKPKNVKFTRTDLKLLANKINFYYFL